MQVLSTKTSVIQLNNKLRIYDIVTLKEKYSNKEESITCISLLNQNLVYGTIKGTLSILNIQTFNSILLHSFAHEINAVFALDNFIYCGLNDGSIYKLLCNGKTIKIYKFYKHNLPIQSIVSDGEEILVNDMTNKVVSYPSTIVYDMHTPLFKYKNYIFIVESNILFCKTKTSLSSYLQTTTRIIDFVFNQNGGVCFILLYNKIEVYNFNTKKLIKEIKKSFDKILYNAEFNKLIGFAGKHKEVIENVLDDEYEEMDDIVFSEVKIYEKHIKIEADETYEDVKRVNILRDKHNSYKKENNNIQDYTSTKEDYSTEEDVYEDEEYYEDEEDIKTYGRRIVESSDESKDAIDFIQNEIKQSPRYAQSYVQNNIFPITQGCDKLLHYSNFGYLVFLSGQQYNKVELRYHDRKQPSVSIKEMGNIIRGTFNLDKILLFTDKKATFYFADKSWSIDIQGQYQSTGTITSEHVVIQNKYIRIYNFEGLLLSTIYIKDLSLIVDSDKNLYVFGDRLVVTNMSDYTENIYLPGPVQWACVDKSRIFYKIDSDIFILYNGLSHLVFENVKYPLTVRNEELIYLSKNKILTPFPNIEFLKIEKKYKNVTSFQTSL